MSAPVPPPLAITGLGLVTPIGHGAWPTFRMLLTGKRLTDRAARYEPDIPPEKMVQGLGGVSTTPIAADDPAVELAEAAAREACQEAGIPSQDLPCFIGTSKGALTAFGPQHLRTEAGAAWGALGPQGYLNWRLAKRLDVKIRNHAQAACAGSLIAVDQARRFMQETGAAHALVVTSESALLPVFIASYERLGVLAPLTVEGYRQTPLAPGRQGFVLASAGAALVLSRVDGAPAPGSILLEDSACLAEPFDLLRPCPDMRAIERLALRLGADGASADPRPWVAHPHATGTREQDPAELAAIARALAGCRQEGGVPVYACKGSLGHSLGAAGLSATVLACLAARTRRLPPMRWLEAGAMPIPAPLRVAPEGAALAPRTRHLVFAAGFGGHAAALRLGVA